MSDHFFIVGIGASAVGESALYDFFENLPHDLPAAYIVVCHLKRDYQSQMKFLLSRHTNLPVFTIRNGEEIKSNCIYLIPENKNAFLKNNHFFLNDRETTTSSSFDIDEFFTSLANEVKSRAVGIILSGIGTDGATGTKAIEESGGIVMVQDLKSSKLDALPDNMVAEAYPDHMQPARVMGKHLADYIKSKENIGT